MKRELCLINWIQKEYNKVCRTFPVDSAHSNVNPVIPNLAIND